MISENLAAVQSAIEQACLKAGRNPEEVCLIAVSKNFPAETVTEAVQAGQLHFGENRAQEFTAKKALLPSHLCWHFIGHLQTNKVPMVTGVADYIHSVDRMKLIKAIEETAAKKGIVQNILIEMKTAPEETKSGAATPDEVKELVRYAVNSASLTPVGLMTIGPLEGDEQAIRQSFRTLRTVKEELSAEGIPLRHLSMGMSGDYPIAIEEGATFVRVGSAIFGYRNYSG